MRDRQHAARDRRRRAAGGAAGRASEVPRVARRAEDARLAHRQDPVLGQRRRADDDEAGCLQAPRHVVVVVALVLGHQPAAVGQAQPLGRAVVLDRHRHARERALIARADGVGRSQRTLGVDLGEGVERGVQFLDPLERGLDELTC